MADFPTSIYSERDTENLPGIIYDPTNKRDLYSEDFQHHAAEIVAIETALGVGMSNVQAPLGFTPENVAHKATDLTLPDNTKYPTTQAVVNALATALVGLLNYRGAYDASGNVFPSSGGSGVAGAIMKGDMWICSVAGTLGGSAVTPGDLIISKQNTPGSTAGNWDLISHDLTFTPENVANKSTDGTMAADSDTLYPSQKAVKTYADGKAPIAAGVPTGGTTNQVLTKNSNSDLDLKWATPSGGGGTDYMLLTFGSNFSFHDNTMWLSPMNSGGGSTPDTEANVRYLVARGGTVETLYAYASANSQTGSIVITVRKNGSNQALTLTLGAGATTGSDLTHSFSVSVGDILTVSAVSGAGTGAVTNLQVAMVIKF